MPPSDRTPRHIEQVAEVLTRFASSFVNKLSADQLERVAHGCLYHYFEPGAELCHADERNSFFFVYSFHGSHSARSRWRSVPTVPTDGMAL
jgi:hypothetical protein